jgi:hypothetical protein
VGAAATLEPSSVPVVPGGEASLTVRIRNVGAVVDEFTVTVLGEAGAWAVVEPPTLSLFPGAEGTVLVRFRPPRSSEVLAAPMRFGVRVASREDRGGSVVEEGTLAVGAYVDVFAELVPRTGRGRRKGVQELAFDNRGNSRLNASFTAFDADQQLVIEVDPPAVVAEPGTASFAKVRVKPRKRFLRGTPKTLPFKVAVDHGGPQPVTADGSFVQEPLIPRWLPVALAALVALLLASALMLAAANRRARSIATDVAQEQVEAAVAPVREKVNEVAQQMGSETVPTSAAGGGTPPTTVPPGSAVALGTPFDARLGDNLAAGQAGNFDFVVPAGKRLEITDVVYGNPSGDSGFINLLRNDAPLWRGNLANFRDLDFHWVQPVVFQAGQALRVRIECVTPGPVTPSICTSFAYFTGLLVDAPS